MAAKTSEGFGSTKTPTRMTDGGKVRAISWAASNGDVARTAGIKHQSDGVSARLDGGLRVADGGHAANFDFDVHRHD